MAKEIRCTKRVSEIITPIREISTLARELDAKGMKTYPLNIGDPNKFDFTIPQYILDAMDEAKKAGWYSDSEGEPALLKAISDWVNARYGTNFKHTDFIATTGISEGVNFLMDLFIEPGDEALLPGPGFPQYNDLVRLRNGKPVTYKCNEETGWQPDMEDIRKKITPRTKFMVMINPNNPTGAVYDRRVVKEFVDIAGEYDLPVVSDEIYDKLIFSGKEHTSALSVAKDVPVIYLNGFSKGYLVPGYRAGYMGFYDPAGKFARGVAKDDQIPEGAKKLARLRLSMSTPIMKACAAAYTGPQDHIIALNRKLKERCDFAHKRLNEIDGISMQKPEGAFYGFFKIPTKDDRKFALDLLEKTGVAMVYGSGFGPYGEGHLRTVILPPVEVLGEAFDKLEGYMKAQKKA